LEEVPDAQDAERLRERLARVTSELEGAQGGHRLLHTCVDLETVAEVIAGWTGIPVGRMMKDEIHSVLNLEEQLGQRIVGQPGYNECLGFSGPIFLFRQALFVTLIRGRPLAPSTSQSPRLYG
jgi:hypothetical protein